MVVYNHIIPSSSQKLSKTRRWKRKLQRTIFGETRRLLKPQIPPKMNFYPKLWTLYSRMWKWNRMETGCSRCSRRGPFLKKRDTYWGAMLDLHFYNSAHGVNQQIARAFSDPLVWFGSQQWRWVNHKKIQGIVHQTGSFCCSGEKNAELRKLPQLPCPLAEET